ncbi:MAG TPA: TPM domain-containing protein [Vicinamibacterales bacterium]|nr:TPM domain-containing protein [Vicinamibacterales bacterium]
MTDALFTAGVAGATAARRMAGTVVLLLWSVAAAHGQTRAPVPELTQPVNDFAHIVDASSAGQIEQTIRALQAASGDVIVVATVPTVEPYADIREYAVQMFQNGGRGIGDRGKDNGLLILVALKERRVWVEVGYGLEPFITDGFSGQVSREVITPEFRNGNYGGGLVAGTNAIATRIAQGRNVQLTGVPVVPVRRARREPGSANWVLIVFVILIVLSRVMGGGPRGGIRRWGRGGWSGWSSGVGPFGGGFGGGGFGGGGGGFGGGFGGFGGGRSGGGGGGSSW